MIERYSRPEMASIWSEENRVKTLIKVELAALSALAAEKKIPPDQIKVLSELKVPDLLRRAKEAERETNHDVVGLIAAISEALGGKAPQLSRYIHYGLTSSDVLDTALALQIRQSCVLLLKDLDETLTVLKGLSRKHALTWMAGRTHGVHAEPITLGIKFAGWHAEALRNRERLERARDVISYGKLSGAVGTFSQAPEKIEAEVCRRLDLKPEPLATQVVPRDRHADFFHALVLCAAAVERWATEIRHLQKTEVLELAEPFGSGQKGSSAMPHKRNPVLCENLCGLSRLIRSYESAVVEDIALWHERDISHSSVERVAVPDALILLDFMLTRFKNVLSGLAVYPDNMRENMRKSLGLMFSQRVMLRLIDSGLERLAAYEIAQRNAMEALGAGADFRKTLESDPDVVKRLSKKDLDSCFDLSAYSNSVKRLLERAGIDRAAASSSGA